MRIAESLRALAKRYGVKQKTIAKWKKRRSTADRPTGLNDPRSSSLTIEEEAVVVALRRHTLRPLDDCLYALAATIPHLTRSSAPLLAAPRHQPAARRRRRQARQKQVQAIADRSLLHRHSQVRTAQGKLHLHVAIARTSKFTFVQLVKSANRVTASAFLEALIAAVPYKIHTVLRDDGIRFTFAPRYADGPTARYITHMFDMRCKENGIEHRLTKVKHPWTNGQVERMNRTIKEATVKPYHHDDHRQLETHLTDFIATYD